MYCTAFPLMSHSPRVLCQNMVDEGYAATQILSQLHESIIEQDLSDKQKSAITEKMAVSQTHRVSLEPRERLLVHIYKLIL